METNYKGLLQVYMQKRQLSLPAYYTYAEANNMFVSTVSLFFDDNHPRVFKGEKTTAKKKAEQSAAKKAYFQITSEKSDQDTVLIPQNSRRTFVLLDLENVSCGNFFEDNFFDPSIQIHGFIASTDNIKIPSVVEIHKVSSSRRDAADIALTLFAGQIVDGEIDVIVVTNDKFGVTLCEILDEQRKGSFKSVDSLSKVREFFIYCSMCIAFHMS